MFFLLWLCYVVFISNAPDRKWTSDSPPQFPRKQHNSHLSPVIKLVDGKASSSKRNSPYGVFPNVAGAVYLFIGRIFDGTDNDNGENYGWKAVSLVAHLLQGDREMVAITSASMTFSLMEANS